MRTLRRAHWGVKIFMLAGQMWLAGVLIGVCNSLGWLTAAQIGAAENGELVVFVLWALFLFLN